LIPPFVQLTVLTGSQSERWPIFLPAFSLASFQLWQCFTPAQMVPLPRSSGCLPGQTKHPTTPPISGRRLLSSFLDNAPTYLVFFYLAGGDPVVLMGPLAGTLTAISLGAVFMGANTYVGNAPNFMVYAIARRAGVKMPSFFAYMLWSGGILLPLFIVVTWLFLSTPSAVPSVGTTVETPHAEAPHNETP